MEWDSEIGGHGLYHTWFRQYDPAQGRWLSVDPLAGSADTPQSLNRYAYVLADPINLFDPLGLQSESGPDDQTGCYLAVLYDEDAEGNPVNILGIFSVGCSHNWAYYGTEDYSFKFLLITGRPRDLKKELENALSKLNCAALLGGAKGAQELLSALQILDVTKGQIPNPTIPSNRLLVDTFLNQQPQGAAAITLAYIGAPILVGRNFNRMTSQNQLTVLMHELRHQQYALGEPRFGTPAYWRFIQGEYKKINEACFPPPKND